MRERKQFSREFKKEAVRLLEEGKKPGADLARELEDMGSNLNRLLPKPI
jgi:transposase-like protein